MDKQTVKDILQRYRSGDCTADERQLVEGWLLHGAASPFDLTDTELLEDLLDIRMRLEHDLRAETPIRKISRRRWLPYAAAVLAIAMIGSIYYFSGHTHRQSQFTNVQSNDVMPGSNKATLTTADGRTIALNPEQAGIIIGDKNITYADGTSILDGISETAEGSLEDGNGLGSPHTQYAILTTPKGGQYQLTLPDGTKVWLNSASKLKYPSRFTGNERVVELEGEAYFEVRKSVSPKDQTSENRTTQSAGGRTQYAIRRTNIPFIVRTPSQEVTVMGTQFNIAAYEDEPQIKTTLVEGAVEVMNLKSKTAHRLIPGQQSIVQNGNTAIHDVDVYAYIGWKEGYFLFNGTELRDAMKQLSRWYDIEIVYEGAIPLTPFYGKISRDDTLAEVLDILKEGKVNFRIEKNSLVNRLIVMP